MIKAAIGAAARAAAGAAVAGDAPAAGGIPETLTITGITDPADSDPLVMTRKVLDYNGFPQWGFEDNSDPDPQNWVAWLMFHDAFGRWRFEESMTYTSQIVSDAPTPVGLTGWTIYTGTGQPTVAGA